MPAAANQTGRSGTRALLICCALVSLCVSDAAGPRLVPLPADALRAGAESRADYGADLIPEPPAEDESVKRLAMAPPARKQAGAGAQSTHLASDAAERFVAPTDGARTFAADSYAHAPASPARANPSHGRAPPRSA